MDITTLPGQSWSAIRREAQAYSRQPPPDAYDRAREWCCPGVRILGSRRRLRARAGVVYRYGLGSALLRGAGLGCLAAADARALAFLYERCGDDPAWQVNEALAMAFDDYCAAIGYAQALPVIRQWLGAPRPNLRRAVSEGLRQWTASKRVLFARDPQLAIDLLGMLRDDESRYVQESVGNALRDIGRKHGDLVIAALRSWVDEAPQSKARRTIARYAPKHAVKADPSLQELFA